MQSSCSHAGQAVGACLSTGLRGQRRSRAQARQGSLKVALLDSCVRSATGLMMQSIRASSSGAGRLALHLMQAQVIFDSQCSSCETIAMATYVVNYVVVLVSARYITYQLT